MAKIVTADEAVMRIRDGATVLINPLPIEEVFPAFGRVFGATGSPKDLTIVWGAGIGPFSDERRGMNHFAYPGMVRRLIGGHYGLNYELVKMVVRNEVEAYNLPQGTLTQLYREIAAKRPGLVTTVGLGTFVDPRLGGGRMNERTQGCEDLVEVTELDGREVLFYRTFPVDVGVIRGTAADPAGNITCDDEAMTMENLEVATAARNCGGFVIAQVGRLSEQPADPHRVEVPGVLVDYVVVAQCRRNHPHTLFVEYDPSFSGQARVPLSSAFRPLPLNAEKVISRRAAMELKAGMNVNLGVGIPMGVAAVAYEEGVFDEVSLSTELGGLWRFAGRRQELRACQNPSAFVSQAQMFDFYDGGGLDLTCVGLAQADKDGNVNVSKIGPRIVGCGGFINVTQSTHKCVFCGEFRANKLNAVVEDGKLVILQEGGLAKFVEAVEQITFSGAQARRQGQEVLFVTERCVFRLVPEGLLLTEVAPGIDIRQDVLNRMEFVPIVPGDVQSMNPAIFRAEPMGLAALLR